MAKKNWGDRADDVNKWLIKKAESVRDYAANLFKQVQIWTGFKKKTNSDKAVEQVANKGGKGIKSAKDFYGKVSNNPEEVGKQTFDRLKTEVKSIPDDFEFGVGALWGGFKAAIGWTDDGKNKAAQTKTPQPPSRKTQLQNAAEVGANTWWKALTDTIGLTGGEENKAAQTKTPQPQSRNPRYPSTTSQTPTTSQTRLSKPPKQKPSTTPGDHPQRHNPLEEGPRTGYGGYASQQPRSSRTQTPQRQTPAYNQHQMQEFNFGDSRHNKQKEKQKKAKKSIGPSK